MTSFVSILRRVNVRHLTGHRLRTGLTVVGIGAGVALVFSISIINTTVLSSFRASVRDVAGAAEIEVAAPDATGLRASAVDQVGRVPGVDDAVPVLRSTARVTSRSGSVRTLVLGVTPAFATLFPAASGPHSGGIELSGDLGAAGTGLVLSRTAVDELDARPGSIVRVETPDGPQPVEVTGIVSGGQIPLLNGGRIGVMALPAAQSLFDKTGRIDSIYVVADPAMPVAEVERSLEEELGGAAVIGAPGTRSNGLERVFAGLGTLLSLAGTVSLFVSLFVVYNTMSMALAERRREISTARALGASRRQLFGAFLAEAAVLGAVSSALGVAGGLLLANVLIKTAAEGYRILPLTGAGPVAVTVPEVALAVLAGLGVSIAGALIPAKRVMEIAPVESLRPDASYEWSRRRPTRLMGMGGLIAGIGALGAALGLFFVYIGVADERWVATLGLVIGFTGVTLLMPHVVPLTVRLIRPLLEATGRTTGRLAADALTKNIGRTTFTAAALVLTLAMVLGVGSALASYEGQVERTATALIGAPIYVTAKSFTGLTSDQPLRASLRKDLERVPGVRFAYPLRFTPTNVEGNEGLLFAVPVVSALRHGATTRLSAITDNPDAFVNGLARGEIAVSRLTARLHSLEVGDELALPTPSGKRSFRVASIYDELISFDALYMDSSTFNRFWNDDKADEFGILLDPGASVSEVESSLEELVDRKGVPAHVYKKDELIGRILEIVKGTFSLGRGIQLAALIVAALTIANTMFTAVLERKWELGLQRAVGMSGAQVGRSVLLEAAAIGAIGGAGGALLGSVSGFLMTKSMEAQFDWRIPFEFPLSLVALAIGGGVVIAAVAGLFPSRIAVRAPIIESLRYE